MDVKLNSKRIIRTYLALMLLSTLAASFIWGVNTLFLLDAGLNNAEAFAANAFFTAGMMIFEIPTGIVADSRGRRVSYLLGTLTLAISTLVYVGLWAITAPFWAWAISSVFIGLGFTFFSGATEAWLVDALNSVKFKEPLESVFAKGQIAIGVAMLSGSFAGGLVAQFTNLGVPFLIRVGLLVITFVVAFIYMRDLGFTPHRGRSVGSDVSKIFHSSVQQGIKNPSVRWLMFAAPFTGGVGIYVFYAMQPYLLELWGNSQDYIIAGLAASIVAGAQIAGGLSVKHIRKAFKTRTGLLVFTTSISALLLLGFGKVDNFWLAIFMITIWALLSAASTPIRQSYLNRVIPSKQRATVLSFDSLMSSAGGAVFQPGLGKVADAYSYSTSLVVASIINAVAVPFIVIANRQKNKADVIER